MARIALTVAGVAAGAAVGYFFPPAGMAVWESVIGGAMAGASVGRLAGAVVDPLHTQGPRLSDLQVSSSTNGTVVPFGYGTFRVSGNIIWAPGLVVNAQGPGFMGSMSGAPDTYNYYASFAASFCQGPATVVRVWGDSTVIYEAGGPSYFPSKYFAAGSGSGYLCGVCGAFTDAQGNLIEAFWVGHGTSLPVPTGATALQLGINDNYQATTAGGFTMQCSVGSNLPTTVYVPSTAVPWEVVGNENAAYLFGNVGGTAPVIVFQNLAAGQTVTIAAMPNPNVQGDGTNYSNGGGTYLGQITPDSTVTTTAEGRPTGNNIHWYGPDGDTNSVTGSLETAPPSAIYPAPDVFTGSEDQQPYELIQQYEGVENTPAFRGLCYAGWENFPLGNFGNRIPNIRAEIEFGTTLTLENETVPPVIIQRGLLRTLISGYGSGLTVTLPKSPTPGNCLVFLASGPECGYEYETLNAAFECDNSWPAFANVGGSQTSGFAGVGGWTRTVREGDGTDWNFNYNVNPYGTIMGVSIFVYEMGGVENITATALSGYRGSGVGTATLGPLGPVSEVTVLGIFAYSAVSDFDGSFMPSGVYPLDNTNDDTGYSATTFEIQSMGPWSGSVTATVSTTTCTWAGFMILLQGTAQEAVPSPPSRLDQVVRDICLRSGLEDSQIDVSRLVGQTVLGYVVGRVTTGQQALQPLASAYFFDAAEMDGLLTFIPRGQASCMSIPEADLGLMEDKREYEETQNQEWDLPRSLQVNFADPAINYQQNKQERLRSVKVVKTRNKTVIEYPMALEPDQAMQIAEKSLFLAYLERRGFNFNLWKALYNTLTPCDVVQFTGRGVTQRVRIIKTSEGAGHAMAITAVSEMPQIYLSSATGAGNTTGGGTPAPVMPVITLLLFDLPLLRDVDANPAGSGYYFCIETASDFQAAQLYACADNSDFAAEGAPDTQAVTYGTALNILAAPVSPWALDAANTLHVLLASGSFANATQAQMINQGANALLVGGEVVQFETAAQQTDGSWIVSGLLRGRRGTDSACSGHIASETVILLNPGGMVRVFAPDALLNVQRYYRAVPTGATLDAVASQTWTFTGNDLKPWSPVAVGGSKDASGNWTICWLRRTRFGGSYGTGNEALVDGMGGPLNEASEAYQVDILGGSPATVKRTINVSQAAAVYSEAEQIADFGGVQSVLAVNVYQMSAVVGRGYVGTATLPLSTDATASLPVGQFYINGA